MNATGFLAQPLLDRASRGPGETAVVLVRDDGERETFNARQLADAAASASCALGNQGVVRGEFVLLALPHSLDLLAWFWGAVLRGAVPVIHAYPSERMDQGVYARRISNAVRALGARALVVAEGQRPLIETGAGVSVFSPGDVIAASVDGLQLPSGGDDLATLQLTSGTTGPPRAVGHSHRALLAQLEALSRRVEPRPDDAVVCWMPLNHDMGLMTGLLFSAFAGIPLVLISPQHWVRRPVSLLKAVSDQGATLCWMPNFAFNHCVRSIADHELEGIDLSRWRFLCSGAEPVRHDSLGAFAERFARWGFRRDALATAYGMTECAGHVTLSELGRSPHVDWVNAADLQQRGFARPVSDTTPAVRPVVSCGRPMPGFEVRVADGSGPLPERSIGEIQLRSAIFTGYHGRPDLAQDSMSEDWFRTGDLGYLADGEVYVCGRSKDVVICGGTNIYPEDVEALVAQVEGIRAGRAAAFGVWDPALGTERLVLVCELAKPEEPAVLRRIETDLRRRVAADLDLTLAEVHLVTEKGFVVKTTSGKVARQATRRKLLGEEVTP